MFSEVAADNKTITLTTPLQHKKLAMRITYGKVTAVFAAEVGLLSRNILIQGDAGSSVPSNAPKCPPDFTTGE